MIELPNLAWIRRRKLLSQEALAALSGVSRNTIHRLETGTGLAQGRTVRRLADALGVDPDELLGAMPQQQELKRAA